MRVAIDSYSNFLVVGIYSRPSNPRPLDLHGYLFRFSGRFNPIFETPPSGYQKRSKGLRLKLWLTRTSVLSIGPLLEVASRFGRTAILSRILVPTQFGTAVALSVVVATVGLVTDMAIDKFVMTRFDDHRALAAAHMVSLARGILLACAIVAVAPSVAAGFGVPQFSGSFALIAIVPLLQGLAHLQIKQIEGSYNYIPEMRAQLVSQVAAFVAVAVAAYLMRDNRAMAIGLIVQSGAYTIASHILARSSYSLWSGQTALLAVLAFGIPLTLNGIGLAIVSQFDRILIGYWFDVGTLGLYAVLMSMIGVPISLMDRVFGKMALSHLISKSRLALASGIGEDYAALVCVFSILSVAYSLFVAVTFDALVPIIFGPSFVVGPVVHVLVTARVFLLLQMVGAPSRLLIASNRTRELSILSFSSAFSLLIAFSLIHWWPSFEAILLGLLIGDIIRVPCFFIVASKGNRWGSSAFFGDLLISCWVVAAIVALLIWNPAFTWEARGTILCTGVLGIAAQLAYGLGKHQGLRRLFFREDKAI
jgi:O-antigen/teichoic acid export membrane protein